MRPMTTAHMRQVYNGMKMGTDGKFVTHYRFEVRASDGSAWQHACTTMTEAQVDSLVRRMQEANLPGVQAREYYETSPHWTAAEQDVWVHDQHRGRVGAGTHHLTVYASTEQALKDWGERFLTGYGPFYSGSVQAPHYRDDINLWTCTAFRAGSCE